MWLWYFDTKRHIDLHFVFISKQSQISPRDTAFLYCGNFNACDHACAGDVEDHSQGHNQEDKVQAEEGVVEEGQAEVGETKI